jgi:hypothetical protein
MDNIIQMNPSKWVSEDLLMSLTGMTKHMIQHARRTSWMEGREYRHVAPDLNPIMYNRHEIDNWVERQRPAIRRRISA